MEPIEVALAFVAAINAQRIDRIAELMTDHHTFVDSDGSETVGREVMRAGWTSYLEMVPDYRIEVEETLARKNTVVLLGIASGTFVHDGRLDARNRWTVPAAWRAAIEGEQVSVWQVYVNPEPMTTILARLQSDREA
jgi:ketosteroid isomerase-like protein